VPACAAPSNCSGDAHQVTTPKSVPQAWRIPGEYAAKFKLWLDIPQVRVYIGAVCVTAR